MGTNRAFIGLLLCAVTLQSTAAQENNGIRFSNNGASEQLTNEERFKIPPEQQDTRYDPILSEEVAESVMRFAHDLGVALDQDEYPNTQIFSPLSVMSALSLVQMGSRGSSYEQLSRLFHSLGGSTEAWKVHEEFGWLLEDLMSNRNSLKRPRGESAWRKTPGNQNAFGKGGKNTPNEHTIRLANGIFVQEGFSLKPDYRYAAQSVYKSEVTPLDFRTRKDHAKHYINSWVNQNTLGKIPAIIADEINPDTNMIIASALYFKGFWEQPFLGSGTAEADFFPDGKNYPPVKVQMMGTGGVYPYYDSPEYNCQIIGLPYKGNQTTMYIIQPRDSTRRSLYSLQQFLTGDKINELISKMQRKTAVIAFPKFHVTNTLHLKSALMRMGIGDVFINGRSDLSLIADSGRYINQATGSGPIAPPSSSSARIPGQATVPLQPASSLGSAWNQGASSGASPASAWNQAAPAAASVQPARSPASSWSQAAPAPLPSLAPHPSVFAPAQSNAVSRPAAISGPIQPRPAVSSANPFDQQIPAAAETPLFQAQPSGLMQSIQRTANGHDALIVDRYNEAPLIFSRFNEVPNLPTSRPAQRSSMYWNQQGDLMTGRVMYPPRSKREAAPRPKRTVTYKVESEFMRSNLPLRLKDLILSKRITKPNPGKKLSRSRRQADVPDSALSLQNLDRMRVSAVQERNQLYVDDVLHKVDFLVNEQGTEAAAATLTYLRRSGTDVAFRCDTPFMILIRHDPTKLPLFYGKVNIPQA